MDDVRNSERWRARRQLLDRIVNLQMQLRITPDHELHAELEAVREELRQFDNETQRQ